MPDTATVKVATSMNRRRIFRTAMTLVASFIGALAISFGGNVGAASAAAPPGGNWTFVRQDAYVHYACKIPMSGAYGPVYLIKTASWYNGNSAAVSQGIGVYAATSRYSDAAIVDQVSNPSWLYGFNGNQLWASAWYPDRLWIQGAYYGPASPWTNGFPVAWLVNC
jgi:hypothetical protein